MKFTAAIAALVATTSANRQQLSVNTLNQVITELNILEKAKLNSQLEVELLDFLQNEQENGSLVQMKEESRSMLLGDTVKWIKGRFTNRPY